MIWTPRNHQNRILLLPESDKTDSFSPIRDTPIQSHFTLRPPPAPASRSERAIQMEVEDTTTTEMTCINPPKLGAIGWEDSGQIFNFLLSPLNQVIILAIITRRVRRQRVRASFRSGWCPRRRGKRKIKIIIKMPVVNQKRTRSQFLHPLLLPWKDLRAHRTAKNSIGLDSARLRRTTHCECYLLKG